MLNKEGNIKIYDKSGMRYHRIIEIIAESATAIVVLRCETIQQWSLWERLDGIMNIPTYNNARIRTRIVSESALVQLQSLYTDVYIM